MRKEKANELRDDFTNPLKQKSEYDLREHFIDGRQKKWKKVIEWILTILGWFMLLSYAGYLIYGSLAIKYDWYLPEFKVYTRAMIIEVQKYFYILFIATLIIIILLIVWKNYNKKRFGNLHRRKFKEPVSNEELAKTFQLDMETIEKIQNERMVVLPTNIIPEDLGIGRKTKQKEKIKQQRKGNKKSKKLSEEIIIK